MDTIDNPPSPFGSPSKKFKGDGLEGASRRTFSVPTTATRTPSSTVEEDGLKFAIFAGGFKRPRPTHFRREQFEKQVVPLIPSTVLQKGDVKFPHMARHYYIVFHDHDEVQ